MLTEYYFAVRYGDIIILLYHEDMMSVWELLFKNSQKEKALKRFLEYCYMIDLSCSSILKIFSMPFPSGCS